MVINAWRSFLGCPSARTGTVGLLGSESCNTSASQLDAPRCNRPTYSFQWWILFVTLRRPCCTADESRRCLLRSPWTEGVAEPGEVKSAASKPSSVATVEGDFG